MVFSQPNAGSIRGRACLTHRVALVPRRARVDRAAAAARQVLRHVRRDAQLAH